MDFTPQDKMGINQLQSMYLKSPLKLKRPSGKLSPNQSAFYTARDKVYKEAVKKFGATVADSLSYLEYFQFEYGYQYARTNKKPAARDAQFSPETVFQYFKYQSGPLWSAAYSWKDFDNFNPPRKEKSGVNAFFAGVNTMIRKDPLKAVAIVGAVVVTAGAASTAAGAVVASSAAAGATVTTGATLAAGLEAAKKVKESVDEFKQVKDKLSNVSDFIKNVGRAQPMPVPMAQPAKVTPPKQNVVEQSKNNSTGLAIAGAVGAKLVLF